MKNSWRVQFRQTQGSWEGPLVAVYEIAHDPISDNYTTEDISAAELFDQWAARVAGEYPNDLIPIYWFISSEEAAKFEGMPFTYNHREGERPLDDFLHYYHWPKNVETGEPLNWMEVPVIKKTWQHGDGWTKGGFIPEATGWTPSIAQPFVFLPSLTNAQRGH